MPLFCRTKPGSYSLLLTGLAAWALLCAPPASAKVQIQDDPPGVASDSLPQPSPSYTPADVVRLQVEAPRQQ